MTNHRGLKEPDVDEAIAGKFLITAAGAGAYEIVRETLAGVAVQPIRLGGVPATRAYGGTFRVTTAPAATKA